MGKQLRPGQTNLRILSPVIRRRLIRSVGDLVLKLCDAGEDMVNGFLALTRDCAHRFQLVNLVLQN